MLYEKRLCDLRMENGLSQEEVAVSLGITRQTVSRWEHGVSCPSSENLIALSKLYGVSVETLMEDGAELQSPQEERTEVSRTGSGLPKRVRIAAGVLCALAVYSVICVSIGFAISKTQTKGVDITPIEELPSDIITVDSYFELGPW